MVVPPSPSVDGIRYVPNFISEAEEQELLEHVYNAPKPKWRVLARRRLQNWGGTMVGDPAAGKQCLFQDESLPSWLEQCIDKIIGANPDDATMTFPVEHRPNHVLVNEYLSGQGIMPHTDGPAFYPLISTISLGSHQLLDLYDHQPSIDNSRMFVGSLLLERRSLVLISGQAYQMLHGIDERTVDLINPSTLLNLTALGNPSLATAGRELTRGTRISLTIRNVEKVRRPPAVLMSKLFGGTLK